jgi:uncharacterized protein (DUF2147 family)
MKRLSASILVSMLLLASGAIAQTAGPVGLWKTIDDASGKPKSLVRISVAHGELNGKIEKLFRGAGEEQNPVCDKCEGARKDQPILGMIILQGLKPDGTDYGGGTVLDPVNGKLYKSKVSLADDGRKLNLRGYIGVPLLGRTQTWLREE